MWSLLLSLSLAGAQGDARSVRVQSSPTKAWPTAVALITDDATVREAADAIAAWRAAVEKDGLATYLVADRWSGADDVREVLRALHASNPPIQGAFLVGEIPTWALHGAEFLTTCDNGGLWDAPTGAGTDPEGGRITDAPYADLDLKLEPSPSSTISGDERFLDPRVQHVRLTWDSPQRVRKELYVGRWSPQSAKGESAEGRVERIRAMLERATAAHTRPRSLSQATLFAARYEEYASIEGIAACVREAFPDLASSARTLVVEQRYPTSRPDERFLRHLCDPELDLLIVLRGDGDARVAIAEGPAERVVTPEHPRLGDVGVPLLIVQDWGRGPGFAPASISWRLLERPGSAVACWRGSTRTADLARLRTGASIGRVHLDGPDVDVEIVGDPTFAYRGPGWSPNRVDAFRDPATTDEDLAAMAQPTSPLAVRLPALRALAARRGAAMTDELVTLATRDASAAIRLEALEWLARGRSAAFEDVLRRTISDSSTPIRVATARLMGEIGRSDHLPILMTTATSDGAESVAWECRVSAARYPFDQFRTVRTELFGADSAPGRTTIQQLSDSVFYPLFSWMKKVEDELIALEDRRGEVTNGIQIARHLRYTRPHRAIGVLLDIARDAQAPVELRKECITTLASYPYSPGRPQVTEALRKLADDAATSAELRDEARRTIRRLDDGPNSPLDP